MIKSAVRVLDLLEVLASAPTAVGVNELARRLAIPRSSTSLLLRTLLRRGYVARDGARLYRIETARAEGWVGGVYPRLAAVARPVMVTLVERTAETAFLGVLTPDWQVQYLAKVVSPREVRYDTDIANRRSPHCTSIGMVLLAYRPEREVAGFVRRASLERYTSRTITSRAAVLAALARIRRTGYAVNVDGRVMGASGVAAPIRAQAGEVVGALNVSAPTSRFAHVQARITDAVLWGAEEISRLLGSGEAAGGRRHTRRSR